MSVAVLNTLDAVVGPGARPRVRGFCLLRGHRAAVSASRTLPLGSSVPEYAQTSTCLVDAAQGCHERANVLWRRRHGAHGVSAREPSLRAAVARRGTATSAECRVRSTAAASCQLAPRATELRAFHQFLFVCGVTW